jgi:hypothetical protein
VQQLRQDRPQGQQMSEQQQQPEQQQQWPRSEWQKEWRPKQPEQWW